MYIENFNSAHRTGFNIKDDAIGSLYLLQNKDDIKEENIKNKVVLIPVSLYEYLRSEKINLADVFKNSKAIICECDIPNKELKSFFRGVYIDENRVNTEDNSISYFDVTKSVFQDLVEASKLKNKVHYCFQFEDKKVKAANIVGMIPGINSDFSDNYTIICGHFDHVGSNKNGKYNPGALDNASGTSGVLELARIFKESKIQPKNPIVFIAFNSEEEGLYGSNYFVSNPIFPLEKAVVFNMDMIGCKNDLPLTIDGVHNKDNTMTKDLLEYGEKLNISCVEEINRGGGSDHSNFHDIGVQAVLLVDQNLTDIHTSRDVIENIDSEDIQNPIKLILYYLVQKSLI